LRDFDDRQLVKTFDMSADDDFLNLSLVEVEGISNFCYST
jgi:hypothetical protein